MIASAKESEFKMRLEKTYISFVELKKHLTSNKHDTLTFAVDQLLLKSHTLNELKEKIDELKKESYSESRDFKSIAIIKKHIRYRQTHNRLIFSKSKADKVRMIALDYNQIQDKLF